MKNCRPNPTEIYSCSSILPTCVACPDPVVGWLQLASLVVVVAAVLSVGVVVCVLLVSYTEMVQTSLQLIINFLYEETLLAKPTE